MTVSPSVTDHGRGTVTCHDCGMKIPVKDPCGHVTAAERGRDLVDVAKCVTEVRDIVEGLHGRPKGKRGVQVVLAEVITSDGDPGWVAKVKFGSMIVAKTKFAFHEPRDAVEALRDEAKKALGVRVE